MDKNAVLKCERLVPLGVQLNRDGRDLDLWLAELQRPMASLAGEPRDLQEASTVSLVDKRNH